MTIPQTQFDVFAFNRATAAPLAGDEANITAELRKDYGAFVATTDVNPSPVVGKPGFYSFDLTAGERDVELELRIFPVSATSGIEVIGVPMFYAAPSTAATIGDWAITRTFETSGGDTVSGVRMSLVGVAGKTDTTGTDGIATIMADDDTFTLRVVVPAGYEDVADTALTIDGADSTATVTLVATTVTAADPPLCAVTLPVVDQYGVRLAGVSVSFKFAGLQAGADPGAVVMSPPPALTSDADGIVQANLIRLANYTATYKTADETRNIAVAVPDAGSYTVADA